MHRAVDLRSWALVIGLIAGCSSNASTGGPIASGTSGISGNAATNSTPQSGAGGITPVTSTMTSGSGGATAGRPAQAGGTTAAGSGGSTATAGATGDGGAAAPGSGTGSTTAGAGGASAGASGVVAAGSGGTGSAGEGADERVPKFEKTRCIDPSKLTAGTELNFPCDGVDIWVVAPTQCMKKACGLVFNIHGGGMTDHATMDQATNMIALGSQADYIVVHPHKGTWSVAQDKAVVFEFMQQVIQAFDVDRKRVHSTGYSQGGQISWAIGCEHADVVASIAPAEEINRVSDCWKTSKLPVRELSVLFAYGKQDSIGGGYDAAKTDVSKFVSTQQMMGPETIAGTESSKYWRQRWTGKSGTVLEFISQNYSSTGVAGILAGHCLPMSTGDTFVSCSLPVDYDWGKEVIEFFKAHPMP